MPKSYRFLIYASFALALFLPSVTPAQNALISTTTASSTKTGATSTSSFQSVPKKSTGQATSTIKNHGQATSTSIFPTSTNIVAPIVITPVEKSRPDPFWYVLSAVVLALFCLGAYLTRTKSKGERKTVTVQPKFDCTVLKRQLEDKARELSTIRGQLKISFEAKGGKFKDGTKAMKAAVLAKIEKAEQEYKNIKEQYDKCRLRDENYLFITCYENPDLDGYASAIAYAELLNKTGKKAAPVFFGKAQPEVEYLIERLKLNFESELDTLSGAKNIILVDASTKKGINKSIQPASVTEVIDHRKVNDAGLFINAAVNIELVGACATLITEKFIERSINISKNSATLLYGAIVSNTLNFRASLTTERDKEAARWLLGKAEPIDTLAKEIFKAKSDLSGHKLEENLRANVSELAFGPKTLCFCQLEIIGAKNLLAGRKEEVLAELRKIAGSSEDSDHSLLSIVALDEQCNYFVTDDASVQRLITEVLGVEFKDDVAKKNGLMMRKQITPLLKDALEKEPYLLTDQLA